ncbi:MAG: dependent oxidoreductase [Chthoniobacteraceae bacterium]|nr:dependent oxidoreductase [Chthoniobacteraceae bacterium]
MHVFDVLVVGGGSAGLAAAVSAARLGARTLLIERGGSLGGTASAALVHSICGLYRLPDSPENPPVLANTGFAAEFASRLTALGGPAGPIRMGRVDVLLQHPTAFARAADAVVKETPNLEIRFHTELLQVSSDFLNATISCRGRTESLSTRTVVDASGDAAATVLGGGESEMAPSERLQRPAFIFAMHGVEPAVLQDDGRLKIARRIATGVQSQVLPKGALGAAFRWSGRGTEAFVTIDLDAPDYDPLDAHCLTRLEMLGRELAGCVADFLQREVTGFSQSFISALPSRIGVRESRRIVGKYRLETHDLETGAQFDDAIALATWPMELRETNRGPRLRYPDNNRPCEIPLRALRARDHGNLFAAGRCIASSHEAQASTRVIGTCLATGEAAGMGAALFALNGECDAAAIRAHREKIKA